MSPKYNRTFHLPWSEGATNDDKIAQSVDSLINIPIVITEKMDGSNVCLQYEGCFARSHAGPPSHPSFDGLKALHASIKHKIPSEFQFFGEWCFAYHSIEYTELPSYFLMFNIRHLSPVMPIWLSWEEVEMWAEEINAPTVPVLFKGTVNSEVELKKITDDLMKQKSCYGEQREGIVVRIQSQFEDSQFNQCVMKRVRANHVTTSTHWKYQQIKKNGLKI